MTLPVFAALDLNAFIARAVLAKGQPLTAPDGRPTRGTTLFLRTLRATLARLRPAHLIAFNDCRRTDNWRREILPSYKADRAPLTEEEQVQFDDCREFVRAFGIRTLSESRFEADDLFFGFVDTVRRAGRFTPLIVGKDKDLMTLLRFPGVQMYDPFDAEFVSAAKVQERWGVPPAMLQEALILMGDATDNVPGVDKVGEKTAAKWLNTYGDLGLIKDAARSGKLTGAAGDNLFKAMNDGSLDVCEQVIPLRNPWSPGCAPAEITNPPSFKALDLAAARPLADRLAIRLQPSYGLARRNLV